MGVVVLSVKLYHVDDDEDAVHIAEGVQSSLEIDFAEYEIETEITAHSNVECSDCAVTPGGVHGEVE